MSRSCRASEASRCPSVNPHITGEYPRSSCARAGGTFAAANYITAACHYKCIVNARKMDTEAVLDNWSDIESDGSDGSDVSSEGDAESEQSVEESEDSSAEEEDTPDSWREVPGTCTLVSMGRKA